MLYTKNYTFNTSTAIERSEPTFSDLGYSLDIPANMIYTAGWQYTKPNTWGKENILITRPDPEYFAPGNVVRATAGLPNVNVYDPAYSFDRSKHTYKLF